MPVSRVMLSLLITGLASSSAALAQGAEQSRIRGTIDTIDAHEMHVTTRTGQKVTLKLPDDVRVTIIAPIAIDAIKTGSFIGTAAVAQPDGTLKALEIQVFPESMRGVGEGHQAWDLTPETTMTNGTVGDLKVANGRTLHLTYKGGEKTVFVPPDAPVITYEPGSRAALVPSAHVLITATHEANETLTATRIGVGKDGLVPPM